MGSLGEEDLPQSEKILVPKVLSRSYADAFRQGSASPSSPTMAAPEIQHRLCKVWFCLASTVVTFLSRDPPCRMGARSLAPVTLSPTQKSLSPLLKWLEVDDGNLIQKLISLA
jgi:hypothetical protein